MWISCAKSIGCGLVMRSKLPAIIATREWHGSEFHPHPHYSFPVPTPSPFMPSPSPPHRFVPIPSPSPSDCPHSRPIPIILSSPSPSPLPSCIYHLVVPILPYFVMTTAVYRGKIYWWLSQHSTGKPDFSLTNVTFPDLSRFSISRWVATVTSVCSVQSHKPSNIICHRI